MKKLISLFAVLLMLTCSAIAENNAAPTAQPDTTPIVFTPGIIIPEDFIFVFEEVEYALGTESAALIEAIETFYGEEMFMYEALSCMFDGMDREFSNDDLVIATYPHGKDGADLLETVMVFSPEYPTARGITIGMDRTLVEEAYGTNYMFDFNQMFYFMTEEENSPMIVFTLDADTNIVTDYYIFLNTGV